LKKATYLSAQLRESAPYLRDAGWRQTATLLVAAAEEIEELRRRLAEHEDAASSVRSSESAIPERPKRVG
jgi:hypothetical protein